MGGVSSPSAHYQSNSPGTDVHNATASGFAINKSYSNDGILTITGYSQTVRSNLNGGSAMPATTQSATPFVYLVVGELKNI